MPKIRTRGAISKEDVESDPKCSAEKWGFVYLKMDAATLGREKAILDNLGSSKVDLKRAVRKTVGDAKVLFLASSMLHRSGMTSASFRLLILICIT